MCSVFRQPTESHFDQAKLALDDPERMLDFRPHARLALLDALERALLATVLHRLDPPALGRNLPAQALAPNPGLRTGVTGVSVHHLFLAVKQLIDLLDIGLVRRRRRYRVHQTRVGVHAVARLHPELRSQQTYDGQRVYNRQHGSTASRSRSDGPSQP